MKCGVGLLIFLCSSACSESVRLDLFAAESGNDGEASVVAALDASISAPLDAARADVPDSSTAENLRLRYDFAGEGSTIADRVGSTHGRALGGAQLDGHGGLALDGVDDYVDLPNQTLSVFSSATLMSWVTWAGGKCWQRVFDFGRSSAGEGNQGVAVASLFLSYSSCPEGTLTAWFEEPPNHFIAAADRLAVTDQPMNLTVVFDGEHARMALYLNGTLLDEVAVAYELAELSDNNAWLGRSQWSPDPFAEARYDEFRIYDRALTQTEIAAAFARGPDAP